MRLISCGGSDRLLQELQEVLDERLKVIVYYVAVKLSGLRVTCIVRTPEKNTAVGGVPNSKHFINPETGKAEAIDFVPQYGMTESWLNEVKVIIESRFRGVQVETRPHGTGLHVHLEIDLVQTGEKDVRIV